MATGHSNILAGQIGEFLTCAELGRRGFIATSFTGNVPEYDLIICDESLRTVPVQVKTTRGTTWPSRASLWLDIEIDDATKKQLNRGPKRISNPDLIYVCVALGKDHRLDRFFVCTKADIQAVCISAYTRWMDSKGWKRPKNHRSLDNRYGIEALEPFEENWDLIASRMGGGGLVSSTD